ISQDRVSVGECWIEGYCLQCCPLGLLPRLLWGPIAPLAEMTVAARQSNISHGVVRVLFFCLLEIQNAFLKSFFCKRTRVRQAQIVKLISLGVVGVMFSKVHSLVAGQLEGERRRYPLRDSVLQLEYVAALLVAFICPDRRPLRYVQQPHSCPGLVSVHLEIPFKNIVRPKLPPGGNRVLLEPCVLANRADLPDAKLAHRAQLVYQRVGHP